jgi:hypothetical protein
MVSTEPRSRSSDERDKVAPKSDQFPAGSYLGLIHTTILLC